jgi:isopenicillin N synthase-like dioxygenase
MEDANFEEVPTLNLAEWRSSVPRDQQTFMSNLRHACRTVGFFYLIGHGMNEDLLERVLSCSKEFFELPKNEKEKVRITLSPHYRGYGGFKEEFTQGRPDRKETFDLGLEAEPCTSAEVDLNPYLKLIGPNLWPNQSFPPQVGGWKETILEFISGCRLIGIELLDAVSASLGLSSNVLAGQFGGKYAYSMLRLICYPSASPGDVMTEFGVGPHVDAGCLVLLLQDRVGGLQVQNMSGKWIDAPHIPNSFVVNIGTMLHIWTNGYLRATPHRVLNHPSQTRYSAPFFLEPNLTALVEPLSLPPEYARECVSSEHACKPVVYGEHMLAVFERSFPTQAE